MAKKNKGAALSMRKIREILRLAYHRTKDVCTIGLVGSYPQQGAPSEDVCTIQ